MNKQTLVQIAAGVGVLVSVPLLYLGLVNDSGALAVVGFAIFTLSMVATPIMKLSSATPAAD